jgi:hypothetical protein
VGLTLAALGAEVVLTDLPNVLDLLRHNCDTCLTPSARSSLGITAPLVEPLTWGQPVPAERVREYDMVVGSDITYNKDACADLLVSLLELCGPETELYIGHLERGDEDKFFTELAREFDVRKAYDENVAEDGVARKHWVHVYRARRRSHTSR